LVQKTQQDHGVIFLARLITAAASDPSGARRTASIRRPMRLYSTIWPEGTELHGVVRGGSGAGGPHLR
jgi:hypothetical protein